MRPIGRHSITEAHHTPTAGGVHTRAHMHTIITYSHTAHTRIRHTQTLLEKGATR